MMYEFNFDYLKSKIILKLIDLCRLLSYDIFLEANVKE